MIDIVRKNRTFSKGKIISKIEVKYCRVKEINWNKYELVNLREKGDYKMLIWYYIPPALYTLIIPGIVFSYGLNYRFSENALIWYLLLGGGILVWKSWYVNYPTKLIFIFKNFKASWFSREIRVFDSCIE